MMVKNAALLEKLKAYGETDAYPFHMPGHKRQTDLGITHFPNPFSVDITEIDGFDDLHSPEGILKEAMGHGAAVYGSDRTYYLVNGSTCGILSALCGVTKTGDRIVMARNSHKSAYHAVFLNQLKPVYIWPEYLEEYGIQGAAAPEAIEAALRDNREAAAVFITSPTYEGIVSDVEGIANIAHRYNIPLIVDEAHGAHFSFGGGDGGMFPKSALDCKADVVIQSLHKTLPSLTQTAVLHIKSELVRTEQIEQYLGIFQTSSPSYVFLAAIENCIGYMEGEGARRLDEFGRRMAVWTRECGGLRNLQILSDTVVGTHGIKGRDCSKVVVFAKNRQLTGREIAGLLRDKYHLEAEMSCQRYVLLMTSLMDSEEGLERLKDALFHIDDMIGLRENAGEGKLDDGKDTDDLVDIADMADMADTADMGDMADTADMADMADMVDMADMADTADTADMVDISDTVLTWVNSPEKRMDLSEAGHALAECIILSQAVGRVSSGFITVYPPGIPALVPGEVFTDEVVRMILYYAETGFTVEGITEEVVTEEELIEEVVIEEELIEVVVTEEEHTEEADTEEADTEEGVIKEELPAGGFSKKWKVWAVRE